MLLAEFMNIVKLRSNPWLADTVCWNNGRYEPQKLAALRNSGVKHYEKSWKIYSIPISHCATEYISKSMRSRILFCFQGLFFQSTRSLLDLFLMRRQRLYWWRLTPPWWNKNANSHVKNFTATAHSVHHQAWRFPNHGSSNLWETVMVWCLKIMKILERRASGHWKKMGVDIQPNCTALIRFV